MKTTDYYYPSFRGGKKSQKRVSVRKADQEGKYQQNW
jgi:hypothetical protein